MLRIHAQNNSKVHKNDEGIIKEFENIFHFYSWR